MAQYYGTHCTQTAVAEQAMLRRRRLFS